MIAFVYENKTLCVYSDFQGMEEIRETKALLAHEHGIPEDKIVARFREMPNVGDIFSYQWGYDQTNVQYFQVTKTTKAMVYMREINKESVPNSESFMSDKVMPVKDSFISEKEIRKKVYWYNEVPHVSMDYGSCELWNGKPEHRSWYA